jgi:hypothetical protein
VIRNLIRAGAALAVAAALTLTLSGPAPAHATMVGCRVYSPVTWIPLTTGNDVMTTNRFVTQTCNSNNLTDIDTTAIRLWSLTGPATCVNLRVELFRTNGTSFTVTANGAEWMRVCDHTYPTAIATHVYGGTRYDVQVDTGGVPIGFPQLRD